MDATTALGLKAAGTEQNRKVYRRHGARDPLFGVSFPTPVIPCIAGTWQRTVARAAAKGAAHAAG